MRFTDPVALSSDHQEQPQSSISFFELKTSPIASHEPSSSAVDSSLHQLMVQVSTDQAVQCKDQISGAQDLSQFEVWSRCYLHFALREPLFAPQVPVQWVTEKEEHQDFVRILCRRSRCY